MSQAMGQGHTNEASERKRNKKNMLNSYFSTFTLMLLGLAIIFSYVYQSTKQVYLNYEIVNNKKEISNLNIKIMELQVENERLQTYENIEQVASEKLGMTYGESTDRVVVIREEGQATEQQVTDDKRKIKIFMNSLYDETYNQLSQFSFENILNYFNIK